MDTNNFLVTTNIASNGIREPAHIFQSWAEVCYLPEMFSFGEDLLTFLNDKQKLSKLWLDLSAF